MFCLLPSASGDRDFRQHCKLFQSSSHFGTPACINHPKEAHNNRMVSGVFVFEVNKMMGFFNPSDLVFNAARATHHQVRQAAYPKGHQGFHLQGHQTGQIHARPAPHSHFNSLRRLTPLLPFAPLPRHQHKHKLELHRVHPRSKAHHQPRHNGKKRVAASRTKATPSFLRLPAERMPGYQTFQLHEVIPRNFQEVTIPASHKKLCKSFRCSTMWRDLHHWRLSKRRAKTQSLKVSSIFLPLDTSSCDNFYLASVLLKCFHASYI